VQGIEVIGLQGAQQQRRAGQARLKVGRGWHQTAIFLDDWCPAKPEIPMPGAGASAGGGRCR
jgi:hypothetical protein